MITHQQLYRLVRNAIRLLRGRRTEKIALAISAACISGLMAFGEQWFPDISNGIDGKETLQLALYVVGATSLVIGIIRIWGVVHPPELPPVKDRPSAIKGPMAFTEADGELFLKLGREDELQKLLGFVLDDQVLMVVIRGVSGAGKTSLLRAGLKHILDDRAVFHYWEAVPTDAEKGLLRAIQEKWPAGVTKPSSLIKLVNPIDELGRQSHVIVLDQFEQLRSSKKIFQLLRRLARHSKPPHRITWIIAVRDDFFSDWMEGIASEYERGFHPQLSFLRLFSKERARDVISQLVNESNLKDSIQRSVINNLVDAATVEGEVSPVDIGIGLLVLAELHERQIDKIITNRDYQFAGGAEGLLTQYVSRCLEDFPKDRKAILKAMLALCVPDESGQRLAEGRTIDELAAETDTDARVLKTQLDRLADRDIRLLEVDTPEDRSAARYRLLHDRLIPALHRLSDQLLPDTKNNVDAARTKFLNAFQAWKTNEKRSRYLLRAKDLRLIKRYETQILWGKDEQEKKRFIDKSKWRRNLMWIRIAAVALLVPIGWIVYLQYRQFEHERYLSESGYPRELYEWHPQLKRLALTGTLDLERLEWLSSSSIEELELNVISSANLSGLTSLSKCRALRKLRLNVGGEITDLTPLGHLHGLRELTLNLSDSQVSNLEPLKQLSGLTSLSLNLMNSPVTDLTPLEQLNRLTHLSLTIMISQISALKPLKLFKRLTQFEIKLYSTKIDHLEPLDQISSLSQSVQHSRPMNDLHPLQQLAGLTHLSLYLTSEVTNLKPLPQLAGLTHLSLSLSVKQLQDLKPQHLAGLTQFTLDLSSDQLGDLTWLKQFTGLTELTLDLTDSEVNELTSLSHLEKLTQLSINLPSNQVSLQPLEGLKRLTHLTLQLPYTRRNDLKQLRLPKGTTHLTLVLPSSQVSDLTQLEQANVLTHLALNIPNNQAHGLKPLESLHGLINLTLDLAHSDVSDLRSLEQLKSLTHLTLRFNRDIASTSKVKDLEVLARLPRLQSLSLEWASPEQRKSLRRLPASLVELKF